MSTSPKDKETTGETTVIIHRPYIHSNCGGEIEEIKLLDRLENKLRCLKCGESWIEKIIIK